MDVALAGEHDGLHAAKTIRKLIDCGIIFVSGVVGSAARERFKDAVPGAEVVSKPFTWRDIEAAFARVRLLK